MHFKRNKLESFPQERASAKKNSTSTRTRTRTGGLTDHVLLFISLAVKLFPPFTSSIYPQLRTHNDAGKDEMKISPVGGGCQSGMRSGLLPAVVVVGKNGREYVSREKFEC